MRLGDATDADARMLAVGGWRWFAVFPCVPTGFRSACASGRLVSGLLLLFVAVSCWSLVRLMRSQPGNIAAPVTLSSVLTQRRYLPVGGRRLCINVTPHRIDDGFRRGRAFRSAVGVGR